MFHIGSFVLEQVENVELDESEIKYTMTQEHTHGSVGV